VARDRDWDEVLTLTARITNVRPESEDRPYTEDATEDRFDSLERLVQARLDRVVARHLGPRYAVRDVHARSGSIVVTAVIVGSVVLNLDAMVSGIERVVQDFTELMAQASTRYGNAPHVAVHWTPGPAVRNWGSPSPAPQSDADARPALRWTAGLSIGLLAGALVGASLMATMAPQWESEALTKALATALLREPEQVTVVNLLPDRGAVPETERTGTETTDGDARKLDNWPGRITRPHSVDRSVESATLGEQDEFSRATLAAALDAVSPVFMGAPVTSADVIVLENSAYTVGFSQETRTPLWAAYRLFEVGAASDTPRPAMPFESDPRVNLPDLVHASYTRSGYDRGHMVPSSGIGRCYGEDAQIETFIVSNICPQHPGCNQRVWERFEYREAHDYAAAFDVIWVIDGPIFGGECVELLADVRVPVAFYKIVIASIDGSWEALAIQVKNERTERSRIRSFLTTVDAIELATEMDFFSELPDDVESQLESNHTPHPRWDVDFELRPTFPGAARSLKQRSCN
jgi:endonuclease G